MPTTGLSYRDMRAELHCSGLSYVLAKTSTRRSSRLACTPSVRRRPVPKSTRRRGFALTRGGGGQVHLRFYIIAVSFRSLLPRSIVTKYGADGELSLEAFKEMMANEVDGGGTELVQSTRKYFSRFPVLICLRSVLPLERTTFSLPSPSSTRLPKLPWWGGVIVPCCY